jgi:xyloglucan-specific exo-beta-1,4-glucanase
MNHLRLILSPAARVRRGILALTLLSLSAVFPSLLEGQTYNWGNVAMGGGGFVSAIVTNKTERNLVYARTDVGGAYRWDNATGSWIPLLDWASTGETGYLGVESLATDPQAPQNVYMLVGTSYFNSGKTAILRSSDYGKTFSITDVTSQFKAHGNGMGRQTGEKLIVDPNNGSILFCGSRANGLFKSTNSGASWTRVSALNVTTTPNANGISLVVLDKASSTAGTATRTLFVGVSRTGTNLYRSNDGGATFTAIAGAPTNLMPHRAVLASDRNLYITYANGAGPSGNSSLPEPMDVGQIWKYNTLTGTWANITPAGFTRAFGGVSVDPANPSRIVASSINTYWPQDNAFGDRVFLSTNGGSNWTDVFARGMNLDPNGNSWVDGHAIHWAGSVEFDPFDTKKVWITSGNGVFRTDDIAATVSVWKFQSKGLEETVPLDAVSIPSGPLISVIGDYDGFRHTDVTQDAPIHTPRMGTTTGVAYAAANPNIVLRVGGSMFYSTNMGVSWTACSKNGNKGKVSISANGNTFLHSPESSSSTYRSTNRGSSWTAVSGLSVGDARTVADPVNSNKFYAYNPSSGAMMVSTNGGSSFSSAGSPGTGGSKAVRTVLGKEGHLWVALNGGGLTRSTNSGQTFAKLSSVSAASAVGLGKEAPGKPYPTVYIWGTVGGVAGVHRSIDEGATWTRVNDDAHEYGGIGNGQFVLGDANVYGRVYMSTVGRGIAYGSPGTSGLLANGTYKVVNRTTGKCLDNLGSMADGAGVAQWGSGSSNNQRWVVTLGSNGYYKLSCVTAGKYLDSLGNSADGSAIGQWAGSSSQNQDWTLEPAGVYFRIRNRANGKYMDVNGQATDGSFVQHRPFAVTGDQQWSFIAP